MVEQTETQAKASTRDNLRSKMFNSEGSKAKRIPIVVNGIELEFRQPTIGTLNDLVSDNEDKSLAVVALIRFSYIPKTEDKLFDDADYDSIMEFAPTGDIREALNEISKLLGFAAEEKEKN